MKSAVNLCSFAITLSTWMFPLKLMLLQAEQCQALVLDCFPSLLAHGQFLSCVLRPYFCPGLISLPPQAPTKTLHWHTCYSVSVLHFFIPLGLTEREILVMKVICYLVVCLREESGFPPPCGLM